VKGVPKTERKVLVEEVLLFTMVSDTNEETNRYTVMRDFRQKEKKKKLPQNKPSRDESGLLRFNISSMAGSAAHGCFVKCLSLRTKNNKKNTYNITTAKKYALHC